MSVNVTPGQLVAFAAVMGVLVFLNGLCILRSGRSIFGFSVQKYLEGSPFDQRTAGLFMMIVGPLAATLIAAVALLGPSAS